MSGQGEPSTWGESGATNDELMTIVGEPVRASWRLLLLAGLSMLASLGLLLAGSVLLEAVPRYVIGWALAGLIGFTLVIGQRRTIERLRHDEPGFVLQPEQLHVSTGLLSAGIVLCGLHAWFLATEFAS